MSGGRVVAVLRAFWRASIAEELQYRGNLIAAFWDTVFWGAMAVLTVAVFFGQTDRLGGWSFWEVLLLLGVFNVLVGVIEGVLRPGVGRLSEYVRTGALDLILVRPVEPQLFVSFRHVVPWRVTDIALGFGFIGTALRQLGRVPAVAEVAAFALTLAAAVAVVYSVWIALMSLAFWFVSVENIGVVFEAVFEAARYPVSAYPGALRFVFVYLLPIAWTTTIPASALTGRLVPSSALMSAIVAVAALAASRLVWLAAVQHYTSAGG